MALKRTKQHSERLEARIPADQKVLIRRAAAASGVTITDFVVRSAQQAAIRVVEQHDSIVLGIRERESFVSALMNPPAPNAALRQAARNYNKAFGK